MLDIPWEVIQQGIINGLALGWVYILMALGLTLIFGIMKIMQLAHGEIYMLSSYIVYYLTASSGLDFYLAIAISIVSMAILGIVLETFLFRLVRGQFMAPIVVSVSLILILQSMAVVLFGLYERSLPRLAEGSFNIYGSIIPADRIVAVCFALILIVLLYLFLKRTKHGQAMVASAQNRDGALLQGISSNTMSIIAMAIGCSLASAGGALAGSLFTMSPTMGMQPLLKGLVIIVIGGMGSLLGAAIGGTFLGLIDTLTPILLNPAAAAILPLLIVILFLLLRPQGLFGHE